MIFYIYKRERGGVGGRTRGRMLEELRKEKTLRSCLDYLSLGISEPNMCFI